MSADESPYNVNLGKVHSGDWTSTSPSSAVFSVRVGFPRSWTATQAEAEVRKVIAELVAGDPRFPVQPCHHADRPARRGLSARRGVRAGARPQRRACRRAWRARRRHSRLGSTTDARVYLNEFGIPAVCFGAIAHDIHGIDESVELQSIVDAARTLARFLLMRFGQARCRHEGQRRPMPPKPTADADAPGATAAQHLGTPIVTRHVADDVVDRLVTAVALGLYVTGQQLPTERELASMLGVSRTSVREALKQLTDTGYLEVRRGRKGGYFVLANWGPTSAEHVRRQIIANWQEFEQIFDARTLVEPLIARTAAARRDGERHAGHGSRAASLSRRA